MPNPHPQKVIDALWSSTPADATHLFAVLDGARNDGIYRGVLDSGCEYECLYRGELDPSLVAAAPYLVHVKQGHAFGQWLVEKGWGDSWGIFIRSTADLRQLRQHLRKFLMVYSPDAKPLYFRYYDPRVLRVYLPTCNAEELAVVFGPVKSYLLENDDPNDLLQYSNESGSLQIQNIPLPAA